MVAVLARYAARFSVRALDVTVDASLLWVGVGPGARRGGAARLRAAAAVRRRRRTASACRAAASAITPGTNRRLRLFAVTQIAASFVLLAGAGMLLDDARSRCRRRSTGFNMRQRAGAERAGRRSTRAAGARSSAFYQEAIRRISRAARRRARRASARFVPWRDAGAFGPGFQFSVEGYAQGERRGGSARAVPHGLARLLRGARRAAHRRPRLHRRRSRATREPVVIVSQSVAQRLFPTRDAREPPPDVDRSGDEVHRRQHRTRAASSASSPTSTTRTSCRGRR